MKRTLNRMSQTYRSLSTSRGVGNFPFWVLTIDALVFVCKATYLPREGPETFVNVVSSYFYSSVYLPIYLARGRKQIPLLFLDLVTVKYSYLSTSRGDSFIRAKDSKSKRKKALMRKQKRNCINKGGIWNTSNYHLSGLSNHRATYRQNFKVFLWKT